MLQLTIEIIGSSQNFNLELYDRTVDAVYSRQYYKNKLASSFRVINTDTVYQVIDPSYNFRIKSLQQSLNNYIERNDYNEYKEALSVDAQGIILTSFLIDKKGHVVSFNMLNSIHPELDKLVNDFYYLKFKAVDKPHLRFKPFKKYNKRHYCEVVIPFEFRINRFYRKPSYFHYDPFWHQNHYNMMNNMRPTIPRFPAGF